MADTKISALPENTDPTGSLEFEANNAGVTQKVTLSNLLADITADYQAADAALTSITTALQTDRAQLVSPAFIGIPTAPTAAPGVASTQLANTLFTTTADLLRVLKTGDTMSGELAMGANKITGLTAGATGTTDAANVTQIEAELIQRATVLDPYDPTATSAAPLTHTTHAGTPLIGDRYRIIAAGSISAGTHVLQIGDIIEANVNTPGDVAGNWSVIQANSVQATTTVLGVSATATDVEAVAKTSTTKVLVPANLASGNFNASLTFPGLVELATQAEAEGETDDTRAITAVALSARTLSDYTQFIGLEDVLNYSAGVWTRTRITQANYVHRKTAGANTPVIGIDITPALRAAASRGFKLVSFDVLNRTTGANLDSHTVTLDRVVYADSAPISVSAIPITGTLPTVLHANPRRTNVAVNTPAFISGDKYIIEVSLEDLGGSTYDFIGLILHFSCTS